MLPGFRTLSTARGNYVVTPTGIIIGIHYRRRRALKPTPLPTVAANEATGPADWPTGGAFVVAIVALFVWAALVVIGLLLSA